MNKFVALILCSFQLLLIFNVSYGNEALGCGGFVKSEVDIDLSQVEIILFNKQGSLKDKAECSPSNGYYFIPVYAKGDYLLKISSPAGWSFEPKQVELSFNGKTDICSVGVINFAFKGFGITGRVGLIGSDSEGAKNVTVELKSDDGSDIRRVTTDINGDFTFTPVSPGKYIVKATHSEWHFSKSEHAVIVESGNTELPKNSLVLSGFDVHGHIDTNGQLTNGMGIALFTKKTRISPLKCTKPSQPIQMHSKVTEDFESIAKCYINTEKTGDYVLQNLPPGQYLIQPVIENTKLKLNISPKYIEFTVTNDTVILSKVFQIKGFSVSGRVVSSENGQPIALATINLNGVEAATTKEDGSYILENVKAGTYALQVDTKNYLFNEQQVKIQLTVPTIPDIIASAYQICGKVLAKKSYVIGITKLGSTFHTTTSTKSETGDWCTYLENGKYLFEVLTTDVDKKNGIQFFPVKQTVEVDKTPITEITFSQLRATLSGALNCLADAPLVCREAEVTLHMLDSSGQISGQKQTIQAKDGKYTVKNLTPGSYEVTIPHSNLCFESNRVLVNINSATETAPSFIHRGYEISIISSHRAMMKYWYSEMKEDSREKAKIKLLAGANTFCVPKAGLYGIQMEGCHLYDDSLPEKFDTNNPNPVIITATAHKVGVRVLSSQQIESDSLKLSLNSDNLGTLLITPQFEVQKIDGFYAYRHDVHLRTQEVLTITPKSDTLLFTPDTKKIIGGTDCIDVAFNFIATKGLIVSGRVLPEITDVKITLNFPENPEVPSQVTLTSAKGEFTFGPINESLPYNLIAEKDSYIFSAYNRDTSSFHAHKLCDIVVAVKDDEGNKLEGVLLSLSGSESYRKNLLTSDSGVINFHSLSPSQYFLRPMMKEYKFTPNSKMIDIKDGETIEIELIGKRVAYSVFGTITSLNGEPFSHVNIEAISDEKCMHHQEESTSENNGQYRIRGLQPGCAYHVQPKEGNSNVARSIPEYRQISVSKADVHDINLIAISPIAFVDVTARVTASTNDYYKTLRVQMYRKGSADSPIYSQRVESPLNPKSSYNPGIMIYFPRIPLDSKTYIVELKTSISEKTYSYVLPIIQFAANTSSIYIELDFKPEVRTVESDLNQNSISALILIALLAIAFFKQDLAMDFVNFIWLRLSTAAHDIASKQQNNKRDARKIEPIDHREIEQMAEQINAIKRKKTKKVT